MGCSCHICPPCPYCMKKEECCNCGKLIHPDEAIYIQKGIDDEYEPLCNKCANKKTRRTSK